VHTPLQAKQDKIEKYKQKASPYKRSSPIYGAMLDNVDENIGKLLNTLGELKLDQNTLVVFTSDNGGFYPVSSAGPLRGNKGMLYEGGIRVPLIVKWPGKIKPGSVSNEPVISMDFFPTLLKVCGIPKPASKTLDGADFSILLLGEGILMRKALYWHFPSYLEKAAGMKEIWRQTPGSAIRKGDWKLIETFEDGKLELFNVKDDIGEQNELSKKYPDKLKELRNDLMQWRKDFNAPVPTALNPDYVSK
jgi:arylsulfatase A-like enzyme